MEIDDTEYTTRTVRVLVMREPADCCQERTTSGGCDCRSTETEEGAVDFAMEHLNTTSTPFDTDTYMYGWVVSFERASL